MSGIQFQFLMALSVYFGAANPVGGTSTITPYRLHTHTHPPTQAPCTPALAHTFSLDTDLTRNTRAPHFTPQHWHLCHMGLY